MLYLIIEPMKETPNVLHINALFFVQYVKTTHALSPILYNNNVFILFST